MFLTGGEGPLVLDIPPRYNSKGMPAWTIVGKGIQNIPLILSKDSVG